MTNNLADAVMEYINYLPQGSMSTPELAHVYAMCDQHPTARKSEAEIATQLLEQAYGSAMDNLPDVAGDPSFGHEATAECCKDIAALAHLLAQGEDGKGNVEAYL